MTEWQDQDAVHAAQVRHQGRRAYQIFGLALLLLLLTQTALPLLLGAALHRAAPWTALDLNLSLLLTYGGMYLVGFPIVWLLLAAVPDRTPPRPREAEERLGPGRILALYAMLSALAGLTLLILSALLGLLGYGGSAPLQELMEGGANPWLLFFLAVVVAPVMEELIFRWLPYRKLSGYGMRYYVIWSALAFGLFHINLLQGVFAAAIGAVLAIITYRTGSVKYGILLHFMVNLTSGLGLGGLLTEGELGTALYGLFHLFLWIAGVIVLLYNRRRGFFRLRPPGEGEGLESWRSAFLSVGYLTFAVLCVALMLLLG